MIDIEKIREYCLAKREVTEGFPFDEKTLVFKVCGKMFALMGLEALPKSINLKCDPERSLQLRDEYESIRAGYHMNKKHWNTVTFDDDLPVHLLLELIDHSYNLVVKGLKKVDRERILSGKSE